MIRITNVSATVKNEIAVSRVRNGPGLNDDMPQLTGSNMRRSPFRGGVWSRVQIIAKKQVPKVPKDRIDNMPQ